MYLDSNFAPSTSLLERMRYCWVGATKIKLESIPINKKFKMLWILAEVLLEGPEVLLVRFLSEKQLCKSLSWMETPDSISTKVDYFPYQNLLLKWETHKILNYSITGRILMLIWFTLWPSISRYLYSFYICLASLCRGCIKLISIIHTPCTNKFLKVLECSLHPINHKIAKGNSLKYRLNVSFEGAMVSAEVSLAISTARILYFVCWIFQFMSIYAKNTMSIKILK